MTRSAAPRDRSGRPAVAPGRLPAAGAAAGAAAALLLAGGCAPDAPSLRSAQKAPDALPASAAPGVRLVDDAENRQLVVLVGPVDFPAPRDDAAAHGHGASDPPRGASPGDPAAGHAHGGAAGPGGGGHHGAHAPVFPPVAAVRFPFDASLHGFGYDLVNARGDTLPREVLHHVNFIDPARRELFLPISQRIAAAGKETGEQVLPALLFGYPVREGQRMVVSAMLHNPTGEPQEGVVLRFRFDYVPGARPWPFLEVYPFQLDVAFPAGDKSFDLPPGRSRRSYEARPAVPGRIVAIGGHLHERAVELRFEDVTAGKVIWRAAPIVGADGTVTGVPVGHLWKTFGVEITPEHTYRATVVYDNPTGDTIRRGGMGVVGGLFRPAVDEWPAADTTDPLYRLDRAHYLREVRGTLEEIASGGAPERTSPSER